MGHRQRKPRHREDRHRRHPTPHQRRLGAHRRRTLDPVDKPLPRRRHPVRRIRRPPAEQQPHHLDHLVRPQHRPPHWTVTASPNTPRSLLTDLSETLAHDTGTRHAQPAGRTRKTSPPTTPPVTASAAASRSR
ncbi:DUF317 domain-containing protein [Streptomyces sp. NPDC051985]|uniref:DUF317 domain-containing protein n=1 Tax=Streptomyces sp. NPDC051985 TaxID=3155807 RepID=UPI00343A9EE6